MPGPLIIHHANCPDGFASAWWLKMHFPDAELWEGVYETGIPPIEALEGREVFIVDFSYPSQDLNTIKRHAKRVVLLDHHQTAKALVNGSDLVQAESVQTLLEADAEAVVRTDRSGVGLVSEYILGRFGDPPPAFLAYIEDRDLWRFELPQTKNVMAAIMARPYSLAVMTDISEMPIGELIAEGESINRFRDSLIDQTMREAFRTRIAGHEVWVAASPYTIGSDVAGRLAEREPHKFAAYFVHAGEVIKWGLRSSPLGMDVAAIAEKFGGGGHRHAAGFRLPADVVPMVPLRIL